jgi:hypothetical protein
MEGTAAGTNFFDSHETFRGCANLVTRRSHSHSGLTIIDVVGADAGLTAFLSQLDRSSLVLREPGNGETLFNFRWASGFVNGKDITIRGIIIASER